MRTVAKQRIYETADSMKIAMIGLMTFGFASVLLAGDAKTRHDDNWSSFRNGNQLRGVAHTTLPEKLELLWKIPTKDGVPSSAAIVDGRVYIGTFDGTVLCVHLKTGENIWTYKSVEEVDPNSFAPGFKASATVTKKAVYIGDEEGIFHAIDRKSGKRLWTYETQGEIISSASVVDKKVIFGSYDNSLYCLHAETGKKLWSFETEGYVNCTPAIAGSVTFVTGCDEQLRVIDIESGKQVRSMPMNTYLIASPAIVGDVLYVGNYASAVVAINWKNLTTEWSYKDSSKDFPYHSSAAVTEEFVVVGGRDKQVHCIDRKTGKKVWTYQTRGRVDGSPAIVEDRVFIGSADGNLYEFNLKSGDLKSKTFLGKGISASPAVGENCLVLGVDSTGGDIFCYGKKD